MNAATEKPARAAPGAARPPGDYRRTLVAVFTFLGGLYFFLEFVLPAELGPALSLLQPILPFEAPATFSFDRYHEAISNGFILVSAMALGLGLINLFMVHGSKILFLRRGWINSVALIFGLCSMLTLATLDWIRAEQMNARADEIFVLRDFAGMVLRDGITPETERRPSQLLEAADEKLKENAGLVDELSSIPMEPGSTNDEKRKNLVEILTASESDARAAVDALRSSPGDMALVTGVSEKLGAWGVSVKEALGTLKGHSLQTRLHALLYDGIFVALGSAMFALLGFYIAAAAYRAFRITSIEAGLMMTAALIVMLGQIPFGLWLWDGFPHVRLWLLTTPSSAAFRAVKLGAEIAGLLIAVRIWLSIESDAPGRGGKRS